MEKGKDSIDFENTSFTESHHDKTKVPDLYARIIEHFKQELFRRGFLFETK